MTNGGPQQGWPGRPEGDRSQEGTQPGYGRPGDTPQGQQPGQADWPQPGSQQWAPTGQAGEQPAGGAQQGWTAQTPAQPGWQPGPAQGQPGGQPQGQAPWQQPAAPQGQPGWQPQGAAQGQPGWQPQGAAQGQAPWPQPGQASGQQPDYQTAAAGPVPAGQPGPGPTGKRKNRTPVIATVIAVVVALIAAGAVYLFARNGSDAADGGQATPQEAVVNLLSSVNDEDTIGIANKLDPAEAHLFTDMSGDLLDQLKRLGIVKKDVQVDQATGTSITTKDITYGDSPITIDDHLKVVELTGGTITLKTDGTNPYTDKIADALPDFKQVIKPQNHTIDLAEEAKELGHPIRIATVERDGLWYPSLFYTVADNWAYQAKGAHYQLDPIGDNGGATPQDAMNKFIKAASSGDVRSLISVLSPDSMGVLHDYGNLMIGADGGLGHAGLTDAQLSNVTWSVSDVTGGKKVSVKTISVTTPDGTFSIKRDPAADSLTVTMPGTGTITVSADNIDDWLHRTMGDAANHLDPHAKEIIKREFSKVIGLGVVMVQGADGKWYVSPLRTFSDVLVSLLSGLNAGDIDYFLKLAHR